MVSYYVTQDRVLLQYKFQVSFYDVCVQIQKKIFGLFLWLIKLPDNSLLLLSQGWL